MAEASDSAPAKCGARRERDTRVLAGRVAVLNLDSALNAVAFRFPRLLDVTGHHAPHCPWSYCTVLVGAPCLTQHTSYVHCIPLAPSTPGAIIRG